MATKQMTRTSVVAIVKEVTEATPVVPSAGTDFIAVHEGFDVTSSFEELTNPELQSSIGMTKTELGMENPTATLSHHLRHSGVEGTAPNFGLLFESCLGSTSVNATERTTDAASTTTLIKLAAGGSDFARGKAILLKDSVNGYSVRNVLSVATNDLTLSQAVSVAPASGVDCGKCVNYSVADQDHPSISYWLYRSNGGAIELVAGSKVVSLSSSITPGQFIVGSFNLEGIEYSFDPLTVTASNKYLDFSDTTPTVLLATLAEDTYKTPYDLAAAIQTAMNGAGSVDSFTVTYSDATRKFTIASDGTTFSILWKTGVHGADGTDNHIGALLGYSDAADDTLSLSYVSDSALDWATTLTPSYDSAQPLVAKDNEIMIGTQSEISCFGASSVSINVTNTKANILDVCATSGKSGAIFTGREVSFDVVGYLEEGQAEEFQRYKEGTEIIFTYNAGQKSGGNWVPGSVVNFHCPTARISSFHLGDSDGIVTIEMTVKAFVKNGLGEFYINCL